MKNNIKHIFQSVFCLSAVFLLCNCETDVENIGINEPDISQQNGELYNQYLSNLRDYKAAVHKTVVAYIDNSAKQPYSQGQTLVAAPDSIDYLVVTSPANTTEAEMAQMDELRAKKATKVLYSISFESIQSDYNALLKDFEANPDNAGKTFISFNNFLVDSVRTALTYCSKFNYDGIVMAYQGKAKLYNRRRESALHGLRERFYRYRHRLGATQHQPYHILPGQAAECHRPGHLLSGQIHHPSLHGPNLRVGHGQDRVHGCGRRGTASPLKSTRPARNARW